MQRIVGRGALIACFVALKVGTDTRLQTAFLTTLPQYHFQHFCKHATEEHASLNNRRTLLVNTELPAGNSSSKSSDLPIFWTNSIRSPTEPARFHLQLFQVVFCGSALYFYTNSNPTCLSFAILCSNISEGAHVWKSEVFTGQARTLVAHTWFCMMRCYELHTLIVRSGS